MKIHYALLLSFPLLICSQSMATEQVLPNKTELEVYQSNLESFRNSITKEPHKTAELFLSNDYFEKNDDSLRRIVEYLPLEKKLVALDSILDACASGKISIVQSFAFFEPLDTDSYKVAPPNIQMACSYYIPSINKLYQKAAKVFDENQEIKQKIDNILLGESRKKTMQDCLLSPWYIGSVPFLSPHQGYWTSLPADKEYSFEAQSHLIEQHAKFVEQACQSLLSLLNGAVKEEEGIKQYELKVDQLKKHSLEFEKLRPLKDTSKHTELLAKYVDELTYAGIVNAKELQEIANTEQRKELYKLRFKVTDFIYPDSYLLEWSASLPLSEEARFGPKVKKLVEEYLKTPNPSK